MPRLRQQKRKHPPSNSHFTCISQKCFRIQMSITYMECIGKRKCRGTEGQWSLLPGSACDPRLTHQPHAEHSDMPRSAGHTRERGGQAPQCLCHSFLKLNPLEILTLFHRPKDATLIYFVSNSRFLKSLHLHLGFQN